MALLPPIALVNPVVMNHHGAKDSRWLMLDVCREYTRNKCNRTDDECRFAHPSSNVEVQNGKVICCFDSIKGKCQRREPPCKYLHPPQHLKEQLLQNGRRNLILRHIQMQFGMQPIYPVHQFTAQNVPQFNTYYGCPTAFASYPNVVATTAGGGGGTTADMSGSGCEMLVDNCQLQDVISTSPPGGPDAGENISPADGGSTSQRRHHRMEVWPGTSCSPPSPSQTSAVVAVDSNGYITSYCSPYYFQTACGIPGMVPMLKSGEMIDPKYEVPIYPSPGLTYPPIHLQQPQFLPVMIPGHVSSGLPRY